MAEQDTRSWWMLRRYETDPHKTFLFHVEVILEQDAPGLFGAVVAGMEDTMCASGASPEEAEEQARLLFMDTVDDAMASGVSLSFAIGNSDYRLLNVPITEAPRIFAELNQINDEPDEDDGRWILIPPQELMQTTATD